MSPAPTHSRGASWAAARIVIALRWPIVALWIIVAAGATGLAPSAPITAGGISGLLPEDSTPIQAEQRSFDEFALPILSRVVVVQHNPDGLPAQTRQETLAAATRLLASFTEDTTETSQDSVLAALPLINSTTDIPSSTGDGTTAVTYLFTAPDISLGRQTRAAGAYADRLGGASADVVGLAGLVPAQYEQARLIKDRLPLVEIATAAFVLLVVGVALRSIVAPLVTVATALLSYLVATRLLGIVQTFVDISVPRELEPLILALLIGVVADYSLFYLYAFRRQLQAGLPRLDAARMATADYSKVILVAGLTVAAGTASLLVAQLSLFRAFGPGLALTVLTGLVISLTLTPALLAILGRFVFWPSRAQTVTHERRHRMIELITRRPVAAIVATGCVTVLIVAASPVREMALNLSFANGLPADNPVQQAQAAADQGFAQGIISPSVLLVEGSDLSQRTDSLEQLTTRLGDFPGVAGALGPEGLPADRGREMILSPTGDAARLLLVLDADPLDANAVAIMQDLQRDLPEMLADAKLADTEATFVGDTAIAAELVRQTRSDFLRIAIAAPLVLLVLLVLLLRSVIAPLFLLLTSMLGVATALGISTWLFQDTVGRAGITFYVPFATAVLLLALGSDYNVFSVGRVWEEARHRSLRDSLLLVVPRTNVAIRTAGIALAGSLALVALIPLWPFQEIAFTMALGLLIDVFIIRTLLVPSLIVLFGSVSMWPARPRTPQLSTNGQATPPG
ncbi:MAG: MMPL family transporter [Ornithinimicrobium sp.]